MNAFMKKRGIAIASITVLIAICIGLFLNFSVEKQERENINEIKEKIKLTTSIYVCRHSNEIDKICAENDILKIVDDQNTVKEFIDIVLALEEEKNGINSISDAYTLYLMNQENEIIVSIDYSHNFSIKLQGDRYYMSVYNFNSAIDEILGINY